VADYLYKSGRVRAWCNPTWTSGTISAHQPVLVPSLSLTRRSKLMGNTPVMCLCFPQGKPLTPLCNTMTQFLNLRPGYTVGEGAL
jgi:hypothetical protein